MYAEAKVTLVEGVPGCGKTTEIIENAVVSDVVLTVCCETHLEMQERLKAIGKKKVHAVTVDSYLLNYRMIADRVWLDEGLMLHTGAIDMIAAYSEAKEIKVFGDQNQIPFINCIANFHI